MNRLRVVAAATLATWALLVAAAAFFAPVPRSGPPGKLAMRPWVERMLRPTDPTRPLVVWLGDSTTTDHPGNPSYPRRIETRLQPVQPVEILNASRPGLDAFQHYVLLGRLAALAPRAVFVLANPRLMHGEGGGDGLLTIASMIPIHELPRSLLLPWHERGITWPRLLLARAMDLEVAREAFEFYQGLRGRLEYGMHPEGARIAAPRAQIIADAIAAYDRPIGGRTACVRMLAASTRLAVESGAAAVIVVPPIPFEVLAKRGLYGSRFLERIAILRREVEAAGGTLIDLHRLLSADEFRDVLGHYSDRGSDRLARHLEPIVKAHLASGGAQN